MGAGTAFLTGFVDAANQSRYEKRMAAHEESVQARADFREDEKEAAARVNELADLKSHREFLTKTATELAGTQTARDIAQAGLQATAATELAGTQTARDIKQAGYLSTAVGLARTNELTDQTNAEEKAIEQLTETLLALNPKYADNPEALARALTYGEDGLAMFTHSGSRYDPDGYLISSKEILDRDTAAFVRANAPLSWRGNEDAWMLTEAAKEFGEMVRKEGGRTGLVTFNDAGMSFENILDEEGAVIGSRIARAQDQGEPWKVEQIEINTARDHIMSHLSNIPGLTGIDMIDGNFRVDNPALFSGIDTMVQNTIRRYAELKTTQEGQYAIVTQVANQILSEQLEGFLGYAKAANTLGFIADGREVSLEDKMESLAYLRGVEDRLGVQAVLGSMTAEEQGKWRSSLVTNVEGNADVPGPETTGEEVVDQGFTIEEVETGRGLNKQTRKIYTLDEVGLNKMSEAYKLHASQPEPPRQTVSRRSIERYVATEFGFNHINPLDREAINQLIKQFETAGGPAAPAIIENDAVRPTGLRGGPPNN